MSTEARRAPVPPRPSTPPPSNIPAAPSGPGETGNPTAAGASFPPVGAGPEPARRGVPAPAQPPVAPDLAPDPALDLDADEEPSVFAPRASRTSQPSAVPEAGAPASPPPPPASARFPDAPPRPSHRQGPQTRRPTAPPEAPSETTTRLRPVPSAPAPRPPMSAPARPAAPAPAHPGPLPPAAVVLDPTLSWSAAAAARPIVSFAEPETRGPRSRARSRTAAAGVCLVLGLGLIGGAVTGSWLTGDGGDGGARQGFATAGTLWHNVPVDQLFPPTVQGTGAGPGGADRTWTRIAVAPDTGCAHAFDPLLHKALAPVGCQRLLRATYTDATQSYVTTVGLLFTKADPAGMAALAARFRDEHLDRRADLMPRPYPAKGTAAAGFGDRQRASWTVSVLTDAPVVAYAVSGWADARTVDTPQPAADAVRSGATTPAAQSGVGNEAQGLADRIERRLRQTVGTATEKPS
ncbi:hypothetical protein [Streptomyces sp. NPDC002676]